MTENANWPTWEDGKPVQIGEVAMSPCGPLRIDGIEIMDGGWRLWSNQSMYSGADKWLYVIDEGEFGEWEGHPAREGEPCEFWQEGDPVMPEWVFAPLDLVVNEDGVEVTTPRKNAIGRLVLDMWHELNYECPRADDGTNGCIDRVAAIEKTMVALGILTKD